MDNKAQDKDIPVHGALAGAPMTLAPSTRGIGPNTYLGISHFWAMLCGAIIVHMAILAIYSMLPEQKVTSIPVRALSFKLGAQESMAAYGLQQAIERSEPAAIPAPAPVIEQPVAQPAPEPVAQKQEVPEPKSVVIPQAQYETAPRQRPVENVTPVAEPVPEIPKTEPVIAPAPVLATPAIAPTPQRYVREEGLPSLTPITGGPDRGYVGQGLQQGTMGGQAPQTVLSEEAAEEIRTRYEQQISLWIERHKIYPQEAGKTTGRVVLRVRVDRQGYVRYYAVERTSGNEYLDRAAIEMMRRANPVPAAPANYPAGNLIEFLIPILFEAP